MKQVTLTLAVLLAASGLSGCQSITQTTYYKDWHDQAYGMRAVRQSQFNTASYQRQAPNYCQNECVQPVYPNDIIPMEVPTNRVDMNNYYVNDNPYTPFSP